MRERLRFLCYFCCSIRICNDNFQFADKMKKVLFFLSFIISLAAFSQADGQKINGQTLSFPRGKTEWSDTIHKNMLTKEMAKEGLKAVPIGIRYKFIKSVEEGNWYIIEITNNSPETKIRFRVIEKNHLNAYTMKLDPKQTKVIEKLYLKPKALEAQNLDNANDSYLNQLYDEMEELRY